MSKQMLTEAEWSRNVGTPAFPVSFLHEYAVGLLWDRLHSVGPVVVTTMDGNASSDLKEGADRVVIPDSMQPIGGCVPDLAILDRDLRPLRVIEVIVSSPPTREKQERLQRLEERGVEVVLVPVRNEEELKALASSPNSRRRQSPYDLQLPAADGQRTNWAFEWGPTVFEQMGIINIPQQRQITQFQHRADDIVREFINAVIQCKPETRRQLVRLCEELNTLEARYPLSPRNPKRVASPVDGTEA
jgi:hypothetical protein